MSKPRDNDLWREKACDHCGREPAEEMPEGQFASVTVSVRAAKERPGSWHVEMGNPIRGTLSSHLVHGGRWERAMAGELRFAEVYLNGLLCAYEDHPFDRDFYEETYRALREVAITHAACHVPGQQTPGTCASCGCSWEYGADERHEKRCPARPFGQLDPNHICKAEAYHYCRCGKFHEGGA